MLLWLVIEYEFTRNELGVEVRRLFKARDVLNMLSKLMLIHGEPKPIRCDNGPELIAQVIQTLPGTDGRGHAVHRPRCPLAERVAESFNSQFRTEMLSHESFVGQAEAKDVTIWWQKHYNHRRPYSYLDYHSTARFAVSLGLLPLQLGSSLPSQGDPLSKCVQLVGHYFGFKTTPPIMVTHRR